MNRLTRCCLLMAVCLTPPGLVAQEGPSSVPGGGPFGGVAPLPRDEITSEQRRTIERVTATSIAALRAEGRLPAAVEGPVLFAWPVARWNGLTAPGIEGIANYVDQDPAFPGSLLDFACGNRTYDLSNGYNHRGTDIFSWPNPWLYMNQGKIAVVAGAPGTIIFVEDGHADTSCSFNSLPWNAVYVRHADGSVAFYGHLRTGSATSKGIGETVVAGEYLGIMGSSGSSTGPHLHFELWQDEAYTQLIDPWQGACNSLNATSRWQSQEAYHESVVNDLTVGATSPVIPACPQQESPNEQYDFAGGHPIYFTMYLRDQLDAMVTDLAILRPDGSTWDDWPHTSPQYYPGSYWWWWRNMPSSPTGTWTFQVTYGGQVYQRQFNIGTAAAGGVPTGAVGGTPLSVARRSGNQYTLAWGDSCKSSDSDFAVYEGGIGDFTTYESETCSTAGEKTWTVTTAEADRFWLVVPRNAGREGSAGVDGTGAPRPQAPLADRCAERWFDCGGP